MTFAASRKEVAPLVEIIDTHAHVWAMRAAWMGWLTRDRLFTGIRRDFPLAELTGQMAVHGVSEVVLVETGHSLDETTWLLDLAGGASRVAGVVGWVSLSSADLTRAQLAQWGGNPALVGIRHFDGWAAEEASLLGDGVVSSAQVLAEHDLALDINLPGAHALAAVQAVARAVPTLRVVLNHLGKPDIARRSDFDSWARDMARLAELPNAHVKYSGWATRLDRPDPEAVRPFVTYVLDCFGVERVLFASNWPVALIGGSYEQTLSSTIAALDGLDETDLQRLFAGNARQVYRLDERKNAMPAWKQVVSPS